MAGGDDSSMGQIFSVLEEFIQSLQRIVLLLDNVNEETVDTYCKGMVFGLNGS